MKTRILIIALALIGLTTTLSNAATPSKAPGKKATNTLVGTWYHNDGDDTDYYQFLADGTGYEWDVEKYAPNNFKPRKKPFKYQIKGDRIIFIEHDGDIDNEKLTIKNKNTIKIDHDVYHRLK